MRNAEQLIIEVPANSRKNAGAVAERAESPASPENSDKSECSDCQINQYSRVSESRRIGLSENSEYQSVSESVNQKVPVCQFW